MSAKARLTITVDYEMFGIAPNHGMHLIHTNTQELVKFLLENDMLCCPPMQKGVKVMEALFRVNRTDTSLRDALEENPNDPVANGGDGIS